MMNEYTKCLIYKACFDGFHADLAQQAEGIVIARVSGMEARRGAAAQLTIVTIDALYELAANRYRAGDDIEALCAATVSQMTVERLGELADHALHPAPERLN